MAPLTTAPLTRTNDPLIRTRTAPLTHTTTGPLIRTRAAPLTHTRVAPLTRLGAHKYGLVAALGPGGVDVLGLLLVVGGVGHDPAQQSHRPCSTVSNGALPWWVLWGCYGGSGDVGLWGCGGWVVVVFYMCKNVHYRKKCSFS